MKNRQILSLTFIAAIALTGCGTAHYKAIARQTNDPAKGLMIGNINHNLSTGGGTVRMEEYGKKNVCEGTAKAAGVYDGTLDLSCTDGRTVKGNWQATGLTSGTGTAIDSKGVHYTLAFGLNDQQIQDYITYQVNSGKKNGN